MIGSKPLPNILQLNKSSFMFVPGKETEIEAMTCPFDPAHLMPKSSLPRHIDRCKSSNKNQFQQCPYDVYHIVKKLSFDAHVKDCPSREDYQKEISESDWNSPEDFCDKVSDQNYRQKGANDWQYQKILTESISRKNNIDFSAELNQSQLAKALCRLNIDQQSDDSEAEQIQIPDGRKGMQSFGSLSQHSSSNRNQKLQQRIYCDEIDSSDRQKALKKACKNQNYPARIVRNQKEEINLKGSVCNASFSEELNSPLSKSYNRPRINQGQRQKQYDNNFEYDSLLYRANYYGEARETYFSHISHSGFDGQSYNNFMIPSKYTHCSRKPHQNSNPILSLQFHVHHHYYHPVNQIQAEFHQSDKGVSERQKKRAQKERKHRKEHRGSKRSKNSSKEKEKKAKQKKQ